MSLVGLKNWLFPSGRKPNQPPSAVPSNPDIESGSVATAESPLIKSINTEPPLTPISDPPSRRPSGAPGSPLRITIPSGNYGSLPSPATLYNSEDNEAPPKRHWFNEDFIGDVCIGFSDGLTVPFALTAGLSQFNDTKVVVYGGLAELIAGCISMGVGGWLSGKNEVMHWEATANRISALLEDHRDLPRGSRELGELIHKSLKPMGLPPNLHNSVVSHMFDRRYPAESLVPWLLKSYYGLQEPSENRATIQGATIAASYFIAGLVPLTPYFFVARTDVMTGLIWSIGLMFAFLILFGGWKTVALEEEEKRKGRWIRFARGGLQMLVVGTVSAGAAMGIIRAFGHTD